MSLQNHSAYSDYKIDFCLKWKASGKDLQCDGHHVSIIKRHLLFFAQYVETCPHPTPQNLAYHNTASPVPYHQACVQRQWTLSSPAHPTPPHPKPRKDVFPHVANSDASINNSSSHKHSEVVSKRFVSGFDPLLRFPIFSNQRDTLNTPFCRRRLSFRFWRKENLVLNAQDDSGWPGRWSISTQTI